MPSSGWEVIAMVAFTWVSSNVW